jgi:hypothetical protein
MDALSIPGGTQQRLPEKIGFSVDKMGKKNAK